MFFYSSTEINPELLTTECTMQKQKTTKLSQKFAESRFIFMCKYWFNKSSKKIFGGFCMQGAFWGLYLPILLEGFQEEKKWHTLIYMYNLIYIVKALQVQLSHLLELALQNLIQVVLHLPHHRRVRMDDAVPKASLLATRPTRNTPLSFRVAVSLELEVALISNWRTGARARARVCVCVRERERESLKRWEEGKLILS